MLGNGVAVWSVTVLTAAYKTAVFSSSSSPSATTWTLFNVHVVAAGDNDDEKTDVLHAAVSEVT